LFSAFYFTIKIIPQSFYVPFFIDFFYRNLKLIINNQTTFFGELLMVTSLRNILAVTALLGVVGSQSAAAQTSRCTYTVNNDWNTGFVATITISNTGSSAINGWNVGWRYTTNSVTNLWNATLSGSNPYSAVALDWNKTIQPGQSISFGFQGNKNNSAVAEVPVVTGAVCGGVGTSASATSQSSTPVPSSVRSSTTVVSSTAVVSSTPVLSSLRSSTPVISSAISSRQSSSRSSTITTGDLGLKDLASFPIGVAVPAGNDGNSILTSTRQQVVALPNFSQFTAENIMKMNFMHPEENTFSFGQADDLIAYARNNGISVHAHTLIWHSDYQVPNFMRNYPGDAAAFSAMLKTHVQTVASHFSGKVVSWDVVNEAFVDDGDGSGINGYRNSIFYQKLGAKFIDEAFINARAADPIADLYYNDYNTEANTTKTTNMLAMIDGLLARRVPINGVGFQMHVFLDWPSTANIEAVFQQIVNRGLKVKISELDVRINNPYNPSLPKFSSLTAEAAAMQKVRYHDIVASYMKIVPAALRGGITVWGVWDTNSWINSQGSPDWPLLFDADFKAKPAHQGFAEALQGN
jgi:endo-1,4-beta-xylanase